MSVPSKHIQPSATQEEAVQNMLSFLVSNKHKFFVLKGFSGTGKTTVITHLINNIEGYYKMLQGLSPGLVVPEVLLTATTNKAAEVLESITKVECKTIHSLLNLVIKPDFKTGKEILRRKSDAKDISDLLINSLVIIDEGSMLNKELMRFLEESMSPTTKVIIVGDPAQLLAVGDNFSHVFFNNYPEFTLTKPQRQDENNSILKFGEQMRRTIDTGDFLPINYDTSNLIKLDGDEFKEHVDTYFKNQHYGQSNKILAWSNAKVIQYNKYVRSLYTDKDAPQKGELYIANSSCKNNGGGLALKNNQLVEIEEVNEIVYGDANIPCYLISLKGIRDRVYMPINKQSFDYFLKGLASDAKIYRKNWSEYFMYKEKFADLRPAHSMTVHKSQGSTFDTVYLDLYDISNCNIPNQVARLLYVAATRARNKVYFYGKLPNKYGGV